MTNKTNIKFTVDGKEYSRDLTVSISKTGATGNVFNEEAKTGFFRWNKGYKYPMFFSSKGAKLVGAQPLNLAIASAVKEVCAAMRQKQTPVVTEENGSVTCGDIPIVNGNETYNHDNPEDLEDDEEDLRIAGGEW